MKAGSYILSAPSTYVVGSYNVHWRREAEQSMLFIYTDCGTLAEHPSFRLCRVIQCGPDTENKVYLFLLVCSGHEHHVVAWSDARAFIAGNIVCLLLSTTSTTLLLR